MSAFFVMNYSEEILDLKERLEFLRKFRKEKMKEIDKLDTEINWLKLKLDQLTKKI